MEGKVMNCQKRILLTGMSGVGKTTILSMLQDENTICIDLDETNYVEVDVKTKEMKERINKRQNNNYGKDKKSHWADYCFWSNSFFYFFGSECF